MQKIRKCDGATMVSKCCWRPETAENTPEVNSAAIDSNNQQPHFSELQNFREVPNDPRFSNGSTNNLLSYEDNVDQHLEITDLTATSSSQSNKRKLVKFHDESQVHEIPAKPKRTPKAERRKIQKLAEDESCNLSGSESNTSESNLKIESFELSQRASVTSLDDLKPLVLDSKEKNDLKKVHFSRAYDFLAKKKLEMSW